MHPEMAFARWELDLYALDLRDGRGLALPRLPHLAEVAEQGLSPYCPPAPSGVPFPDLLPDGDGFPSPGEWGVARLSDVRARVTDGALSDEEPGGTGTPPQCFASMEDRRPSAKLAVLPVLAVIVVALLWFRGR